MVQWRLLESVCATPNALASVCRQQPRAAAVDPRRMGGKRVLSPNSVWDLPVLLEAFRQRGIKDCHIYNLYRLAVLCYCCCLKPPWCSSMGSGWGRCCSCFWLKLQPFCCPAVRCCATQPQRGRTSRTCPRQHVRCWMSPFHAAPQR